MRKLGSIIAFSSLAGSTAFAADLGVNAPLPPPVVQAINWTGFYIGGNLGGVVAHASGTSDFTDTAAFIASSNPQTDSFSQGGFLGGAQAGFNWQFSPLWVAGLEADWDWINTKYSFCRQTDPFSTPCADTGRGFEAISSKTEWLATVRGRLGVAWENWLFYATGGAAFGRVRTDLTLNCLVNGCGSSGTTLLASSTSSTTTAGWVAGLGAELMLGANWSARAEWLHLDLGTISNTLPTVGNIGIQTASWSRNEAFDEFRLGLTYLFR